MARAFKRYNEILVGRYNRSLQKLLGLKGGPPAPQLSKEVQVSLDLFHGREWLLHQGWLSWAVATLQSGGVGQNAGVRLRNPGGSGVIAVVEALRMSCQTPNNQYQVDLQPGAIDLFTSLTAIPRDVRIATTQQSTCRASASSNTAVLSTNPLGMATALAQTNYDMIWDEIHSLVLTPGFVLQATDVQTNAQTRWTIWWRERALEDGELVQ